MEKRLWDDLTEFVGGASSSVVLVAPFIKKHIFDSVIAAIPSNVTDIRCFTRWDPSEVASGVSDPEIFESALQDSRISLFLAPRLHAKLFVADEEALVGSANLTSTALGLARVPNLEILIRVSLGEVAVIKLLSELGENSRPASRADFEEVQRVAALFREYKLQVAVPFDAKNASWAAWLPRTPSPESVFRVYSQGSLSSMSEKVVESALLDMLDVGFETGLSEDQFRARLSDLLYGLDAFDKLRADCVLTESELTQQLERRNVADASSRARILSRWLQYADPSCRDEPEGFRLVIPSPKS